MADAPDKPEALKPDWRSTVFLPRTDFPMKAGLPQKEPAILARWQSQDLYGQVRRSRAGREKFILHDGPPYANGDIHIGHTLNKVLKDMVVRSQTLLGKDAPYVPGWDCHGLPIEWKIEEQYRKQKKSKDEVPLKDFRAECRAYAAHWVDVQSDQFQRLGITGDWANPYLTMDYDAEATIVAELMKFAESGQLYRGAKPVMWSPVEKTALAEAEIEYEDIVSTQIDVAFEIVEAPNAPAIQEANAELARIHAEFARQNPELVDHMRGGPFVRGVIWTTTPWTIPVNQAIAFGPDVNYALVWPDATAAAYLVAEPLLSAFIVRFERSGPDTICRVEKIVPGEDLRGAVARHPMHQLGGFFAKPRPFLPGEFVTTDQGTGLVHMAPDHGEDDFELCRANGIDPVFAVEADGRYRADWAWLGGQGSVINAKFNAPDGPICSDLREAGALLAASADFQHSYPHSWRSKAKVIYRCTPQWFIAMDRPIAGLPDAVRAEPVEALPSSSEGNAALRQAQGERTLRDLAIAAIAGTRFVPEKGRNRIGAMVEGRPDWVISRQRAWGVPIALFVERQSGELLVDVDVNHRIVEAVRRDGVDAWSDEHAAQFLGPNRDPDDFERVTDILDVWFDSGSTHVFTLESGRWPDHHWPADLYLEGSDQHRGWFQSSLLESCGTRGRAPFKAVLTHGFTMDAKGMKMSKSLGNTINPLDLMKEQGADILRLWALSVDSSEDHRIGKEILAGVSDQYRKLRNTFRYLLGALDGFTDEERVTDVAGMPELERYMLALTAELAGKLRQALNDFDFPTYTRLLADFANNDLSAFYFDIRKDCLYCEVNAETGVQTDKRRAYRTVLDTLFHALVRWLSPVLVFTSEEVWGTRFPDGGSVHLLEWPNVPSAPTSSAVFERWNQLKRVRQVAFAAAERARASKEIGTTLAAEIAVVIRDEKLRRTVLDHFDVHHGLVSEIFISSQVNILRGAEHAFEAKHVEWSSDGTIGAAVFSTDKHKCGRCWRHLPEVREDGDLCARCDEVVHA
jgi:isoleucyl-tRNA synthetase